MVAGSGLAPPNPHPRRLAAIDHPRKARSYDYQSSPYTIDGITEEGRNTTDWRFFYDNADRLMEAHGGFLQDFTFDYDQADNLTRMATPDGTTIMHPDNSNARDRNESVVRCHQLLHPDAAGTTHSRLHLLRPGGRAALGGHRGRDGYISTGVLKKLGSAHPWWLGKLMPSMGW